MVEVLITCLVILSLIASSMWFYHEERGTFRTSWKDTLAAFWRSFVFGVALYLVIPWILTIVILDKIGLKKLARLLERRK